MLIHQIWIGNNAPPQEWMNSVVEFCGKYGHTYKFWGNKEIKEIQKDIPKYPGLKELEDEYMNRDFNDKWKNNYRWAGLSDIYRLIILYNYGGMFVDADSVVINPGRFDSFLRENSDKILAAWEKPGVLVANGVISSPAGHPFFKKCLMKLGEYAEKKKTSNVWERTGPYFITDMMKSSSSLDIKIVPKHFFYPVHWDGIKDFELHKKQKFHPDSMLFQYGYSTNGLWSKMGQMNYWNILIKIMIFACIFVFITIFYVVFYKIGIRKLYKILIQKIQSIQK
ncbi:MAG: hypothetical protein EBT86_00005 [Actinobacteria bacterium]|nr:hypothetical protein [Actinomycetota bacterium]